MSEQFWAKLIVCHTIQLHLNHFSADVIVYTVRAWEVALYADSLHAKVVFMDGLPLSVYIEADEKHAEKLRPIAGYRLSYCANMIASSAMQESRV